MSLRARLALTFGALALVLVAVTGFVARRALTQRLVASYEADAEAAAAALRETLTHRRAQLTERLAVLAQSLRDDNRTRLALRQGDADLLRMWAPGRMAGAGFDALELLAADGRVLSSGQFPAAWGTAVPNPLAALRDAAGPVLLRVRRPDSTTVVLGAAVDFSVAAERFVLVGGVGASGLGAVPAAPGPVRLVTDAGAVPPPAADAIEHELVLPLFDLTGPAVETGAARYVLTWSLAPLLALRADLDRLLLTLGALATLVAALLGGWLAGRQAAPIAALAGAVRRADAETPLRVTGTDRQDEVGTLARALGDLTARLARSTDRLREAERRMAVGDVARQVNHDVKNGLIPVRNVVRHLAEVARDAPEDLARVFAERRESLERGIEYLEELARRYAQLTPAVGQGTTDLHALIQQLGLDGRATLTLSAASPLVQGDPTAVRRVVENLVRNALDAAAETSGAVTVETASDDGMTVLTITDTGPGMTREQLDKAFSGFFTTKTQGTGLGLTVARRLVGDLGGTLKVETEPGVGTTAMVRLKTYRPADLPASQPS